MQTLRRAHRGVVIGLTLLALHGGYGCAATRGAGTEGRPLRKAPATVRVGDSAPNFVLEDHHHQPITLSDYRGRKVVLVFYVFSFSPDCASQLTAFQQNLNDLEAAGVEVMGVSMDGPYANKAFAEALGVRFRLLSDRDGSVARAYGIYDREKMVARRTTCLIDEFGKVTRMRQDGDALDPKVIIEACIPR